MNDLTVNVRMENDQMITDSRNVSECFGKRHDHILRDIENIKEDSPNFGEMFFESTMPDSYGRNQKVYYMNRDGFTLLAMGFTGKEALQWKLKYISAFNALEKMWNTPEMVMKRALEFANNRMNEMKLQIGSLEKKIEDDKPKVVFADAVTTSKSSILVGELAKLLKQNGYDIGQNRLFEKLRNEGYLMKAGSSKNMPTQLSKDMGLIDIKISTVVNPDGSTRETKTPKITGKGQEYFINKFLKELE